MLELYRKLNKSVERHGESQKHFFTRFTVTVWKIGKIFFLASDGDKRHERYYKVSHMTLEVFADMPHCLLKWLSIFHPWHLSPSSKLSALPTLWTRNNNKHFMSFLVNSATRLDLWVASRLSQSHCDFFILFGWFFRMKYVLLIYFSKSFSVRWRLGEKCYR